MARVSIQDLLFICAIIYTLVNVYISFSKSTGERYYASVEELTGHNDFFSIGIKSYGSVEKGVEFLNEGGDLEDDGDGGDISETVEDRGVAGRMRDEYEDLFEPEEPDDPDAEFGENEDFDILDLDQDVDKTQHGPDVDMMMGDDAVSLKFLKKLRKNSMKKVAAVAQPEVAAAVSQDSQNESLSQNNTSSPKLNNKITAVASQDIQRESTQQNNTASQKASFKIPEASARPTLVLYVGPRGVVTALLQKYLLGQLEPKLLADGWEKLSFKFTKMQEMISKCFQKNENCSLWPKFLQECNRTLSAGKNVLYISETLSKIPSNNHTVDIMRELQSHWDVRVLLAYRRLYDWLPSLYAQERKKYVYDFKTQDFRALSKRKKLSSKVVSFASYVDNDFRKKPTDALAVWEVYTQIYGKENVFVFDAADIANPRTIVSNFVAQGLPEAEQTRLALETEPLHLIYDDKELLFFQSFQDRLDHDLLISHALERDSIRVEGTKVETLFDAIDRKLQALEISNMTQVNPRISVSEDSKLWLWNRTIAGETNLIPPGSKRERAQILAEWGEAASSKFSTLDASAVLASPGWENVFQQLGD